MILTGLSENDVRHVELLLRFIDITKEGMVKPYDPVAIIEKLKRSGFETSYLEQCCPVSAEVRDAKDFRNYTMAAVRRVSDILKLDVQ